MNHLIKLHTYSLFKFSSQQYTMFSDDNMQCNGYGGFILHIYLLMFKMQTLCSKQPHAKMRAIIKETKLQTKSTQQKIQYAPIYRMTTSTNFIPNESPITKLRLTRSLTIAFSSMTGV